eukprot:m.96991 g.96991  ORF g.96991 m.96991 type:complete len:345 (+) comp16679_c0_seq1:257-1291(+)
MDIGRSISHETMSAPHACISRGELSLSPLAFMMQGLLNSNPCYGKEPSIKISAASKNDEPVLGIHRSWYTRKGTMLSPLDSLTQCARHEGRQTEDSGVVDTPVLNTGVTSTNCDLQELATPQSCTPRPGYTLSPLNIADTSSPQYRNSNLLVAVQELEAAQLVLHREHTAHTQKRSQSDDGDTTPPYGASHFVPTRPMRSVSGGPSTSVRLPDMSKSRLFRRRLLRRRMLADAVLNADQSTTGGTCAETQLGGESEGCDGDSRAQSGHGATCGGQRMSTPSLKHAASRSKSPTVFAKDFKRVMAPHRSISDSNLVRLYNHDKLFPSDEPLDSHRSHSTTGMQLE